MESYKKKVSRLGNSLLLALQDKLPKKQLEWWSCWTEAEMVMTKTKQSKIQRPAVFFSDSRGMVECPENNQIMKH